jgi:hypothetical protein
VVGAVTLGLDWSPPVDGNEPGVCRRGAGEGVDRERVGRDAGDGLAVAGRGGRLAQVNPARARSADWRSPRHIGWHLLPGLPAEARLLRASFVPPSPWTSRGAPRTTLRTPALSGFVIDSSSKVFSVWAGSLVGVGS